MRTLLALALLLCAVASSNLLAQEPTTITAQLFHGTVLVQSQQTTATAGADTPFAFLLEDLEYLDSGPYYAQFVVGPLVLRSSVLNLGVKEPALIIEQPPRFAVASKGSNLRLEYTVRVADGSAVALRWNDVATSGSAVAEQFELQRSYSVDGPWGILLLAAPWTEFVDTRVVAGKTYAYRVQAQTVEAAPLWMSSPTTVTTSNGLVGVEVRK